MSGWRYWGSCPDPSTTASSAPVRRASSSLRRERDHLVIGSVNHEHRDLQRFGQASLLLLVRPLGLDRREDYIRGRLEAHLDPVANLLLRVRLAEALGGKELEEPLPVLLPVVAVELQPAVVAGLRLVEYGIRGGAFRVRWGQREARRDEDRGRDSPRRACREDQRRTMLRPTARQSPSPRRRQRRARRERPLRTPSPSTQRGPAGRSEAPLPRPSNVITV